MSSYVPYLADTLRHPMPLRLKHAEITALYRDVYERVRPPPVRGSMPFTELAVMVRACSEYGEIGKSLTAEQRSLIHENNFKARHTSSSETHLLMHGGKFTILPGPHREHFVELYARALFTLYGLYLPRISALPRSAYTADNVPQLLFEYVARLQKLFVVEVRTMRFRMFMDLDFFFPFAHGDRALWIEQELKGRMLVVRNALRVIGHVMFKAFSSTRRGAAAVEWKHPTSDLWVCTTALKFDAKRRRVKVALHLTWPHCVVDQAEALRARLLCVHALHDARIASDIDWYDVVDRSVFSHSGLRMIGSLKAEQCCADPAPGARELQSTGGGKPILCGPGKCGACYGTNRSGFRCACLRVYFPTAVVRVTPRDTNPGAPTTLALCEQWMRSCVEPITRVLSPEMQQVIAGFEAPHVLLDALVEGSGTAMSDAAPCDVSEYALLEAMRIAVQHTSIRCDVDTPLTPIVKAARLTQLLPGSALCEASANRTAAQMNATGSVDQCCSAFPNASGRVVRSVPVMQIAERTGEPIDDVIRHMLDTNRSDMQLLPEGDKRARALARELMRINVTPRKILMGTGKTSAATRYVVMTPSRYCENVRRMHRSNHVWYVVDVYGISQRCYKPSGSCVTYRGPDKVLTPDGRKALFSAAANNMYQRLLLRAKKENVPPSKIRVRYVDTGRVERDESAIAKHREMLRDLDDMCVEEDDASNPILAREDSSDSTCSESRDEYYFFAPPSRKRPREHDGGCTEPPPPAKRVVPPETTAPDEDGVGEPECTEAAHDARMEAIMSTYDLNEWAFVPEARMMPERTLAAVSRCAFARAGTCFYQKHTAWLPIFTGFLVSRAQTSVVYCDECYTRRVQSSPTGV